MASTDEILDRIEALERENQELRDQINNQNNNEHLVGRRGLLASLGLLLLPAAAARSASADQAAEYACVWLGNQDANGFQLDDLDEINFSDGTTLGSASAVGSGALSDSGNNNPDGGDQYVLPNVEDSIDLQGSGDLENAASIDTDEVNSIEYQTSNRPLSDAISAAGSGGTVIITADETTNALDNAQSGQKIVWRGGQITVTSRNETNAGALINPDITSNLSNNRPLQTQADDGLIMGGTVENQASDGSERAIVVAGDRFKIIGLRAIVGNDTNEAISVPSAREDCVVANSVIDNGLNDAAGDTATAANQSV